MQIRMPPSFSLRPSTRFQSRMKRRRRARDGGDDDDRLNGSVAAHVIIQPMCAIASAFSVNGCSAIITIESYVKTHQKHREQ